MTIITKIRQRIADYARERRIASLCGRRKRAILNALWFKSEAAEHEAEYRRLNAALLAEDRARSLSQQLRMIRAEILKCRRAGDAFGVKTWQRAYAERAAEHIGRPGQSTDSCFEGAPPMGANPADYRWLDGTPSRTPRADAAGDNIH